MARLGASIRKLLVHDPGVRGVPLSYVVRENEAPDHETDFGNDFTARSIACAPLNDSSLRADARKVHQLLIEIPSGRVSRTMDKGPHTSC